MKQKILESTPYDEAYHKYLLNKTDENINNLFNESIFNNDTFGEKALYSSFLRGKSRCSALFLNSLQKEIILSHQLPVVRI